MKVTGHTCCACATIVLVWMVMLLSPEGALAADPDWRPSYDVALRWINFIILVAVIVKYGRAPILDFLKLQKGDVVSQIEALDAEKGKILSEIKAAQKQGVENQTRFKELKNRLIAQGETHKQQIIEQAKRQSAIMLEATGRKMEHRIVQAKAKLKMELLDMAIDQATATLPSVITDGDNQRLLDDYMNSLHS